MNIAFFLLRRFWKPLALLVIAGVIFSTGYLRAKRTCNNANLRAEIATLKRQAQANQSVLEQAARASEARAREAAQLQTKVDTYEALISDDERCILDDDDAERLRTIR